MTTELATQEVDSMDALMDALDEPKEEATVNDGEDDPLSASAEDSDDSEQTEAVAPDLVDLDGKKLEIPKGTPPELVKAVQKMADDLKADYTRKTQGAAESTRVLQMKEQNLQQQEQLFRANAQRMTQLQNAQERLSQYEQIDWQSLIDADPVQAQKLQVSYQQERSKAESLHREFVSAEEQRQQAQSAMRMQALQDGAEKLAKAIPKWGPTKQKQVMENTLTYGYTPEDLQQITDPRLVMALHDAAQWKALQAQKSKVMQKVVDAPRVVKPNAPQPRQENKSALDRLRKSGRAEDLASLL